jgi:hypothetical protein
MQEIALHHAWRFVQRRNKSNALSAVLFSFREHAFKPD